MFIKFSDKPNLKTFIPLSVVCILLLIYLGYIINKDFINNLAYSSTADLSGAGGGAGGPNSLNGCYKDATNSNQDDCPYDKDIGAEYVNFKWTANQTLGKNSLDGSKPIYCGIICTRDDSEQCSGYSYLNGNRADGQGKDSINPEGAVAIMHPKVGNKYKTICIGSSATNSLTQASAQNMFNAGISQIKTNATSGGLGAEQSREMQVASLHKCAEYSFGTIMTNLGQKKITYITEKNFRGWATDNPNDHVEINASNGNITGNGSGDKSNIIFGMESIYAGHCPFEPGINDLIDYNALITKVKDLISINGSDKTDVINLGLTIVDSNLNFMTDHSVILTSISESNGITTFNTLDPNMPGPSKVICGRKNESGLKYNGYQVCYSPDFDKYAIFWLTQDNIDRTYSLKGIRQSFCSASSTSGFCTRKISLWLNDNYPNIINGSGGVAGFCNGWSIFVIHVAYLGYFDHGDQYNNYQPRDCHPGGTSD
jgi:hypothetical protein